MDPDILYAMTVAVIAARPEMAARLDGVPVSMTIRLVTETFIEIFGKQLADVLQFTKDLDGPHRGVPIIGEFIPDREVAFLRIGDKYYVVHPTHVVGGIATPPSEGKGDDHDGQS